MRLLKIVLSKSSLTTDIGGIHLSPMVTPVRITEGPAIKQRSPILVGFLFISLDASPVFFTSYI